MDMQKVKWERNESAWVSRTILDEVVIMPLCKNEDAMQYLSLIHI